MPPTLPKPWTTQRCSDEPPAEPLAGARDHHHDARARRLVAEHGAADRDRLAGHDLGHRVAALHRVGVHHPGHRLLVRRHVRRGDVLLRPDERQELGREPPGEALELDVRHLARVAADAALRAAVRQAQQRALPRHPDRERRALAERDLRVVANAALRRAEHARVLHPVAGEDDARAVVELDRARDDDRPLGVAEPLGDPRVDVRVRDGLVELRDRRAVERRVELEVGERRDVLCARHGAVSVSGTVHRELAALAPSWCAGAGSRTPMSRRTAGFKPAASDQFRHPGAWRASALAATGKQRVGREPLRALELVRVEERGEGVLVERRALREVRRVPSCRRSTAPVDPGAERDLVPERRIRREDVPARVLL